MTETAAPLSLPGNAPSLWSRLRQWTAVRIAVHAVFLILVVVASAILTRTLVPAAPSPWHHGLLLAANLLSSAVLLAVYALTVRWLERRGASELNLRKGLPLALIGAALGTALMAAVYLGLWLLGFARFAAGSGWDGLDGALVAMFAVAVLEELVLRAVLFRLVEEASGTAVAVLVSALVFGLIHGLNPGATAIDVAAVAIEAGVAFALAYALTRNLWLTIGMHAAWNFTEGSVFGAQVSGYAAPHSQFRATLNGPNLFTGGAFGPEGSVIAIAIFAALSIVIAALVVREGQWRGFARGKTMPATVARN